MTGLQAALAAETAARQAADAALTTLINNIQTSIGNALNAETAARQAGDAALQNAISAETAARQAAAAALQATVNAQGSQLAALGTQVTTLQSQVANNATDVYVGQGGLTALDNNAQHVVVSVNVPAGSYYVTSIIPVFNLDGDDQSGQCQLSAAPPPPPGFFANFGTAFLRLESGGTDQFNHGEMALIGAASFASNATITVGCTGFNWYATFPAIMAIKVRTIQ